MVCLRPSTIIAWGLLGLALQAADPSPPPETASTASPPVLRGQVRGATGEALAGAQVRVLPTGLSVALRDRQLEGWVDPVLAVSSEAGTFEVRGVRGRSFTMRVEAPGHAPRTLREVPAGAQRTIALERGVVIRGRTVELGGEKPLAGAVVRFCDEDALVFGLDACGFVKSDERGEFAFAGATSTPNYVRATALHRAPSRTQRVEQSEAPLVLGLAPGAWLRGRVLDQRDEPVEGARLRVAGQAVREFATAEIWSVLSDRDGRFVIEGLAGGERHAVHGHRADRPPATAGPFLVEAGRDLEVVVRMPAAAELRLGLVDPEGATVADFDLFLQETGSPDDFGPLARAVPADSIEPMRDGRFKVRAPDVGRFDVLIVPAGYAELRRDRVALLPGETTDLGVLELVAGRTVEGRVLDEAGEPIATARIQAWDGGPLDSRARETTVDAEGAFAIAGLREGAVTLYAEARGFFPRQERLEEVSGPVEITLSHASGLTGRVETSEGEPPQTFTVLVHGEADAGAGPVGLVKQQSFAAGDGNWRIEDVGPGRYTVEARAEGWAPGRRSGIELVAAKLVEVPTIVLARGLTIGGRVEIAADEQPLAGATVTASQGGGWIPAAASQRAAATTDEEGRFELAGLEPGFVTLRATYPGLAAAELEIELGPDTPVSGVRLALGSGGSITGTVHDRYDQPLEGRTLVLAEGADVLGVADTTALTDAAGAYEFPHVVAGSHIVRLLPGPTDGFAVIAKTAVVREGEVARLDFEPDPAIRLSGFVLRDERPLPRASLYFTRAGEIGLEGVKLAQAGEEGRYEVGLDAPGRYRVMVQTGPTGGSSTEIDVPLENEVVRDIVLASAGIGGTVTDEQGEPVVGAAVAARPDIEREPLAEALLIAETDESGRYAIQGLSSGIYRVTAVASGYRMGELHPVEVNETGAAGPIDFRLERGDLLRGRVVDAQGRGVAGAYVFAAPSVSPDPLNPASAETDVNGAFEMTAPAEGRVDVSAYAAGWAPARMDGVDRGAAGASELVLSVDTGGSLRVQVLDAQGRPAAALHLLVRPIPAFVGSEIGRLLRPPPLTDPGGVALIGLLSPGVWEVAIAGRSDVEPQRTEVRAGVEQPVLLRLP